MTLLLDIGNSRIKWWLHNTVLEGVVLHTQVDELIAKIVDAQRQAGAITAIKIASVARTQTVDAVVTKLKTILPAPITLAQVCAKTAGVTAGYTTLEQLGVDRWLAMLAAYNLFGKRGCVVIDAGSALTVDFLQPDGQHIGGLILPGVQTMAKALFDNTRGVAVESLTLPQTWRPGCDTLSCVEQGVTAAFQGLLKEIDSFVVGSLVGAPSEPAIVVTGGDAAWFLGALGERALHEPRLVLQGLTYI